MKFLAETHDPRTQPAIAKALKDFEMGKTDDEVRVACESINAMAKAGVKLDQTVSTSCGTSSPSSSSRRRTASASTRRSTRRSLNVHERSYGDKAIDKLKGPAVADNVDSQKDQLMWWQLTSVQVISDLRYTKAVKPLLVALLTPSKTATLGATIQFALLKMAKDAEPELIKALNGQDPDYVKAAEGFEDKANIGVIANVLAQVGRAPCRDAILAGPPGSRHGHGAHRARPGARADAERPAQRAGVPRGLRAS